jgi:hypothetical protein
MARLNTGEYKVDYYDGYGSKLRDMTETAVSLDESHTVAKARLDTTLTDGDLATAKSYTVDRRIFNSLE